jgi:putative intracellular protease/amidase
MRTRWATALAGIMVGLAASAAAAGAQAQGHATEAGRQYRALARPVTAAFAAIRTQSGGWVASTCSGSACRSPGEQPVIVALEHWQRGLLRDRWPAKARADVRALVLCIGTVVAELRATDQPNPTAWATAEQRDFGAVVVAANAVRSDIGLEPTVSL